jgi:hypothetical protein
VNPFGSAALATIVTVPSQNLSICVWFGLGWVQAIPRL